MVEKLSTSSKFSESGSTTVTFPSHSMATATTAPASPTITPSMMNGQRMNQFVAPTSRITSTSRRRA
jgi:hypothetical protein